MSIVTKVGDKGTTKLFTGTTVSKHHLRIVAYGTVDELVSNLGLARSVSQVAESQQLIHTVQRTLFQVGAELATDDIANAPFAITPIADSDVLALETQIQHIEPTVKLPPFFIIPGGTTSSAAIDVARTVCRRAEQAIVGMWEEKLTTNMALLRYMNRLSDLLFLLARVEEQAAGIQYDQVK